MMKVAIYPVAILAITFSCVLPSSFAYADYLTPEPYAGDYLSAMAEEAGMTENELVVYISFATNVTTGINSTKSGGVSPNNSLAENLANLVDTSDYPDWDTLTSYQKGQWENDPTNYYMGKFNQWVAAGLDGQDALEGFYGSQGGNFEWESYPSFRSKIQALHNDWDLSRNVGITYEQMDRIFNEDKSWFNDFLGNVNYAVVKSSDFDDWPDGAPSAVKISYGRLFTCSFPNKNNPLQTDYMNMMTSRDMYWMVPVYVTPSSNQYYFGPLAFDVNAFQYGVNSVDPEVSLPTVNSNSTTGVFTDTGNRFNYCYRQQGTFGPLANSSFTTSNMSMTQMTNAEYSKCIKLAGYLLEKNLQPEIGQVDEVVDYPQAIGVDIKIYLPSNGFNNETPWSDYVTPGSSGSDGGNESIDLSEIIALLERNNDLLERFKYDSLDLKVHDLRAYQVLNSILAEIRRTGEDNDIQAVVGDLDFPAFEENVDDLTEKMPNILPFGVMFLLSDIFLKISAANDLDEPVFDLDFGFAGDNSKLEIDLSFLEMVHPLFNFIAISALVLGLVRMTMPFIVAEVGK